MNVLNEITVTYEKRAISERITSSADAEEILRPLFKDTIEHRESMYVMFLNRSNEVIGYYLLGLGGTCGVVVDVKILFSVALKVNASYIIMAHNHPSGNLDLSRQDDLITKKVKEGGAILDVQLLDHLVLTKNSYKSYADEGLLTLL